MRLSAIFAIVLLLGPVASGFQAPRPAPIFVFETNELWLNLHHFLYVLGRAHVKAGDATREASLVRRPKPNAACKRSRPTSRRCGWTR